MDFGSAANFGHNTINFFRIERVRFYYNYSVILFPKIERNCERILMIKGENIGERLFLLIVPLG